MLISDAQKLLKAAGYYSGPTIGMIDRRTLAAVALVRHELKADWDAWDFDRRVIAAGQHVLNKFGHEAGAVDGLVGHNTNAALDAWNMAQAGYPALSIDRSPSRASTAPSISFPRQSEMEAFYGPAGGPRCTSGSVKLPFAHKLAWDTSQLVRSFSCHELVAPAMQSIFDQAAQHYGEKEYRRLRLDLYGGCYNFRKMRGGSALSTHAYGAAVDLDPERNQLRWNSSRASFARAEYEPFWKIVEANGAVSLGREKNFDWMHFQFARL